MPDKQNGIPSFEESFVDKSWSQMHELLDEQLPATNAHAAQKNSGNFLGLAILLFVSGLVSGVFLYSLILTTNQEDAGLDTAQSAFFQQPLENSSSAVEPLAQLEENSQRELYESQSGNVSSHFPALSFRNSATYIVQEEINFDMHPSEGQLAFLPTDLNVETLEQEKEKAIEIANLSNKKKGKRKIDLAETSENKKIDPAVGLKAGINVMRENLYSGYYGGLIAQYPVSGSIIFNTGLLYTSLQSNAYIRYAQTPTIPGKEKSSSITYAELEEMEYISLPLAFSYQPFQFMRFNTGVNLSYLINSESYYASIADNPFSLGERHVSPLEFNNNAWNNLDVRMIYGMTLFPNPNWGVDISYNMGMMDISKNRLFNVDDHDTQDFYQISVMYYFLRK